METTTKLTLCPTDVDLENYKFRCNAEEMTADQVWVDFHVKECDECRGKIE